jgi:hypothetical protein
LHGQAGGRSARRGLLRPGGSSHYVALLGCWDLKRVIYYLSSTGSQATNGTRAAHTATKPNAIPAAVT